MAQPTRSPKLATSFVDPQTRCAGSGCLRATHREQRAWNVACTSDWFRTAKRVHTQPHQAPTMERNRPRRLFNQLLAADSFSADTVKRACLKRHGIGRVYHVTETCLVLDASRGAFGSAPLRRRALAVRFAGLGITELSHSPLQGLSDLLNNVADENVSVHAKAGTKSSRLKLESIRSSCALISPSPHLMCKHLADRWRDVPRRAVWNARRERL